MRNSMHVAGVTTSPSIDDQRIMLTKLISKNKKSLDRGFLVTQKSTDEDSSKKYMNSL
jgi:phage portal protein BeeE